MSEPSIDHRVRLDDLKVQACVPGVDPDAPLAEGQVMLRVDRFALTANNLTYAAFGHQLGYWLFFPAEEGWGRVPAWGFADVLRSAQPEIAVGERLYGYVPMSSHALMTVGSVREGSLVEGTPHRRVLPPAYNGYVRVSRDPVHRTDWEEATAVLRPLFVTSWLLDDLLADEAGLEAVVLTSASSRTALGLAHRLKRRPGGPRVVGFTGSDTQAFVERTGYYDEVWGYGWIKAMRVDGPAAIVDFAGRENVLFDLHLMLPGLRRSLRVGATHWDAPRGEHERYSKVQPEWFFAPDRIVQRTREWGRDGYEARLDEAWRAFVPEALGWMTIERRDGCEALTQAFAALLDGSADPSKGVVLRL